MFGFLKKKKPEIGVTAQTANEFVNVKDVKGNILYSKNGYIFAYLKITPIAIELLSPLEKKTSARNLTASLSSETKPFKILAISRPVDIGSLIQDLHETFLEATIPEQKKLLKNEIEAINDFALVGEVVERQFYVIIWEKFTDNSANELNRRVNELASKFKENKIEAIILDQSKIIQLCNLFANPNYAHLENVDIKPAIPFIKEE